MTSNDYDCPCVFSERHNLICVITVEGRTKGRAAVSRYDQSVVRCDVDYESAMRRTRFLCCR